MSVNRPFAKRYRSLVIASLISGGSLLNLLPALADQNSATPGDITNQATAEFQDALDSSITGTAISNTVKVTVVEIAGISAIQNGFTGTSSPYRTNTVYFEFKIKNEGNDPSKLFIPAKPSVAKMGTDKTAAGTDLSTAVGQLKVIKYNATGTGTDTALTTGNAVDASTGSSTADLGIPDAGSISPGGYVIVQVPITLPSTAVTGEKIFVTLGNIGTAQSTNSAYVLGNTGTATTVVTDLYTVDNGNNAVTGETAGAPFNGDGTQGDGDITKHRQETAAEHEITIVDPPTVNISGTVWDDGDGSGSNTFGSIRTLTPTAEGAALLSGLNAVLIDGNGKVVKTVGVSSTDGTYTFTGVGGLQTGMYVVLSKNSYTPLTPVASVVASLPTGWAGTTPLTYGVIGSVDNRFNILIADITGKDFGIEQLPTATAFNVPRPTNPAGTDYPVPLVGADTDGTVTSYRITVIPDAATIGTFYYDGVAVTSTTFTFADPTKLRFDPVDGNITLTSGYVAIDNAGKESAVAVFTLSFNASNVGITGRIWHDKDSSAAPGPSFTPSFTNIFTTGEVGTNAVFGTTITPIYATLVDVSSTPKVLQSVAVAADGTYLFDGLTANLGNLKIIISTEQGTLNSTTIPTAGVPTGWVNTSPVETATISTGTVTITKDFGIRQKAKLLLLKRITKINGLTTNPNDSKVLNGSTTDDHNTTGTTHWPASELKGVADAGKVKPGDKIEYTIYFINNQGAGAKAIKLCDPIIGNQSFDSSSDIVMSKGGVEQILSASTSHYAAGGATTAGCNVSIGGSTVASTAAEGIVIPVVTGVNVLPAATGPATSTSPAYGYFKFTTIVKP
jgi:hypothetical protein